MRDRTDYNSYSLLERKGAGSFSFEAALATLIRTELLKGIRLEHGFRIRLVFANDRVRSRNMTLHGKSKVKVVSRFMSATEESIRFHFLSASLKTTSQL